MNKFLYSLLLLSLVSFTSCGDSPFLEKGTADDSPVRIVQGLDSNIKFEASKLSAILLWRVGPVIGDESKVLLLITDMYGTPTNPTQELRVKLWMPTMGHGSFPVQVTNTSTGVFELTDVFFTMGGYWDIHLQLFDNDNLVEEVKWGLDL